MGIKDCHDLCTVASIAVEFSKSSIGRVEDLWSQEKIIFIVHPEPQAIDTVILQEIIMRSIEKYLKRPGHVRLPDDMIPEGEFDKERRNELLRVRKLWEYWHGSTTLNSQKQQKVGAIVNTRLTDNSLTTMCIASGPYQRQKA